MEIKIYQNYYLEEHKQYLDPAFVPHDNTENKEPELREYPILKKLHEINKDKDLYWGLVSWRWKEKNRISGEKYIKFIESASNADVYHINHDLNSAAKCKNVFVHGEQHHKGMMLYFNRLSHLMGWNYNFHLDLEPKYFITCHFYAMHTKLWGECIQFLDKCLEISYNDESLNYYIKVETTPRYGKHIPNFSFVVERLIALFCILNNLKVIEYFESTKWTPSVLRR